MTEEEARDRLKNEGYQKIYAWFDSLETDYPTHHHPNERNHFVIQGQMTVTLNDETLIIKPGDNLLIPAELEYTAVTGPEGCMYVVGEKSVA